MPSDGAQWAFNVRKLLGLAVLLLEVRDGWIWDGSCPSARVAQSVGVAVCSGVGARRRRSMKRRRGNKMRKGQNWAMQAARDGGLMQEERWCVVCQLVCQCDGGVLVSIRRYGRNFDSTWSGERSVFFQQP
jgi:hypothetical protein